MLCSGDRVEGEDVQRMERDYVDKDLFEVFWQNRCARARKLHRPMVGETSARTKGNKH